MRRPDAYNPLVPESIHMPTFVCSNHRFWKIEPVPKLPSSGASVSTWPSGSRSVTWPSSPKSARRRLLPVP